MSVFLWVMICLMGLCWGSFLNVLIVRTLSGESIIMPPSKCPKCGHSLYWWHNIPLVSFLILQGKCYFCNKSIDILYPIIEFVGMAIVLFSFIKNVSIVDALSVVIILSMFLVLSFTDVKERKVSVIQCAFIILAGFVFNRHDIMSSVIGGLVGAGIVMAISYIGSKFFNKVTFGVGDIYLLGALGAVVGIDRLFLFIIYALFLEFLLVIPQYVIGLIRSNQGETLKYLIIFGIACLFLYVSRNISFFCSNLILAGFLWIVLFAAYKLIRNLFSNLENPEIQSECPLTPAIAISCLIFLC